MDFEERDIDNDQSARKELVSLGSRSIPTFKLGDNVMIGFDPEEIKKALANSEN